MASSRSDILDSLRRNRPAAAELPIVAHDWTTFNDRRAKFIEVLELVGGHAIVARDAGDLREQISQLPQVASARKIVSLVSQAGLGNVDTSAIQSPHDLADIDVAILPAQFAVAENAAVWVTDQMVPLRVLFFLCQHLILVVPNEAIVDHMHAAYERIQKPPSGDPAFQSPRFGAFISGPSKTADIEQSLIIGAHGPRSLVVCFLESAE
jgi:L-lactate dehydrogenase complex protein LldG